MTNSELLSAISEIFEATLDKKLDARLKPIEDDIKDLKSDMKIVKSDIKDLQNNVQSLTRRVEIIESRLASVETRVEALETKSDSTDHSIASISNAIINIQLLLENQILPRLQTIESCYLDTYERYSKGADKIQATIDDVDILKKVVHRHSELLQMTS